MLRIVRILGAVATLLMLAWGPPVLADTPTHLVQPGETLFRIALNHGVTVDALRAANGIVGNTIYAGQVLVIPSAASEASGASAAVPAPVISQPVAPAPSAGASNGVHTVQRGENLFRIGLKYGVSVAAIQAANGLANVTIYVGQQLTIPSEASVVSTASAASTPPTDTTAAPAPQAPAGNGRRFLIDLSEQMLYAYEGDTLVRSTLVSTGLPQTPTVVGTFYIYLRYRSQRMIGPGYDLPSVPYVMYFYKGYGLHGTYWHNNFGAPMSHGCVNMPTAEAEWAYNWSSIGTPVTVQY
ncbi:MAG: LysM peptidoglycan-binding domain-containing protein [Chloroflexi bacterium]|nr:LysM peptidoglycan-binding domain-containing protein [Chloroflexota bacterium]